MLDFESSLPKQSFPLVHTLLLLLEKEGKRKEVELASVRIVPNDMMACIVVSGTKMYFTFQTCPNGDRNISEYISGSLFKNRIIFKNGNDTKVSFEDESIILFDFVKVEEKPVAFSLHELSKFINENF